MSNIESDRVLMERMAARDAGAVGELYDRHNRLLFGVILRILGNGGDAEKVLEDVFIAVWNRSESYDATLGAPIAWLVRIARTRALDRLRAAGARVGTVNRPAVEPAPAPDALVSGGDVSPLVVRALESLPAEQRELIEQAYFQGLAQTELAERHQLPPGTVKTRIRAGMLAIRAYLSRLPQ